MASVYIETTNPSYYFETREEPMVAAWREATRLWWDTYRVRYQLVTSGAVLDELAKAPPDKAAKMLAMLESVVELDPLPALGDVVEYYIAHRLVPTGADAVHLAMASLHNVDFLLTWNCRHLANANKARHLTVLNGRLGLNTPAVVTPLVLVPEDEA